MTDPPLKILIVDDEPDMCWALHHLLKELNIQSVTAFSGQEAFDIIASDVFRLALIDAKLPDIDGLELAERIRILDRKVGIIMVSGYFYRNDVAIKTALQQGTINAFVSKPFLHEDIQEIIRSQLSGRDTAEDRE